MRVLLTGHEGYIGTVMASTLRRAGHEVHGLDTGFFRSCIHGPAPSPVDGVTVDLRELTPAHLVGFDAVVHLAALSNDPLGNLQPEQTYEINHAASVRLAEYAKAAGVKRFLYASSCSVYGASSEDGLVTEEAPMVPVTPYAVSKVRVEEDLHALADASFHPTYMRNATAYGWSPRPRLDLVLNDLVARAMLTGEITVLSDGTPWRPLVHVEDIADAFRAALEADLDAVHDEPLNVGDESGNHRVREIADLVAAVFPDVRVVVTGELGSDPRSYRVSFAKIRERLPGFRCRWTVRAGAEQLADAFARHGLDADQHTRVFKRLPWLHSLTESGQLDATLRWREPATV